MKRLLIFLVFFVPFVFGNVNPSATSGRPSPGEVVNNPVMFTWTYFDADGDELEYSIVQIDDDRMFFSPQNYKVVGSSFKIYLDSDGEYYWRVQAVNNFGSDISEAHRFFVNTNEKVCSDGTSFFECSFEKPLYCDSEVLKEKCSRCGCDVNGICQEDGSCLTQRCPDGTIYGSCSSVKPRYCFQGLTRDVCSLCGCPNGFECTTNGSCVYFIGEQKPVPEPAIEIKEKLTLLERIARFFKFIITGETLYK